jgi:hypothetical protein
VNADEITGVQGQLLTHNMFAYCINNPVNMEDQDGNIASWIIGGGIGALVGGSIGAYKSYKTYGKVKLSYVLSGVAIGGLTGAGLVWIANPTVVYAATILPKLGQKAIDYAVSNTARIQHAFNRHGADFGFGNWNKGTAKLWQSFITSNLQNYTKTFQNTLGNDSVTGYYRYVNGMHVATYIFNSGKYKGFVATVVKLSAQQLQKFRL